MSARAAARSIYSRFAAIAATSPDRIAIRFDERGEWAHWSYAELSRRVGSVTRSLREAGVAKGDAVAVASARHPDVIVALLAILARGASYLPLDLGYPAAHRQLLCDAAGVRLLLVPEGTVLADTPTSLRTVVIDGAGNAGSASDVITVDRDDRAYVLFTSGSTGRPKGVQVPQRAVLRLVDAPDFMALDGTTVFLHLAPLGFDASTLEIWGPLLNGGTCVIYPADAQPDAESLGRVVRETGVTSLWLTASLFNAVVDRDLSGLAGLRELLTGGEVLSVPHVAKARQQLAGSALINGYGPTENTTFTACYRVPSGFAATEREVPIGSPIRGTDVLLVDAESRLVSEGAEGELVALGEGVALGYLGAPELTAERFRVVTLASGEKARGYFTGDRAVRRADGALLFRGRLDSQVKIEGHRIEPAEVERAALAVAGVRECRVLVRTGPLGQRRLVAYVVTEAPSVAAHVRASLANALPAYLVPHFVIALDRLPLTANGKLDADRLPDPFAVAAVLARSTARSPAHAAVRDAWSAILGREGVAEDVNFFEAGGSSLDALLLHESLETRAGRELEPTFVFEHTTINRQAAALEGSGAANAAATDRAANRRRAASAPPRR